VDISGSSAELHTMTDANNLANTVQTAHLPEQRETMRVSNQLRREVRSGAIDDLARVISVGRVADCPTKSSAKPDCLIKAANAGILPNADERPPFRELTKRRRGDYLASQWDCR
jgi:hypothetical protein